ncbi:hypothetical protein [Flexivirga caeni]|nr:hypothetical protein [Flexivirga caeni]
MTVLVHLCRACGHQQAWHSPRCAGYTSCHCCRTDQCEPTTEPVVLPTFSFPGWHVEPLVAPGTVRNAGTMHASQTCACAACLTAYERLAAQTRQGDALAG